MESSVLMSEMGRFSAMATHDEIERAIWVQDSIIQVLLERGADLMDADNSQIVPFQHDDMRQWMHRQWDQLVVSSENAAGWGDDVWSDVRTLLSVNWLWYVVSRQSSMIKFLSWVSFAVLFVLSGLGQIDLLDQEAHGMHEAVVGRFAGKPFDFSEQPNKRWLDADTRQDFWNFMKNAVIPGIFDSEGFYFEGSKAEDPIPASATCAFVLRSCSNCVSAAKGAPAFPRSVQQEARRICAARHSHGGPSHGRPTRVAPGE